MRTRSPFSLSRAPLQFVELNTTACHCKTPTEKDCQICRFTDGFESPTKTCTSCKRSKYFRQDTAACVEAVECPENTIPTGESQAHQKHPRDTKEGRPGS